VLRHLGADNVGRKAVNDLIELIGLLEPTPVVGRLRFDPSLARGLSYYTGAIMEINVPDMAGSLGGGGRYDNLIGMFLGRDVPACGFSLGLERMLVVMSERKMFPESVVRGSSDVMVTLWNNEMRSDSLALATTLRAAGLRVDVYPEPDKIGKQFKYASGRKVPFVAVVGDDERARGEVTIKDMRSSEQKSLRRSEAAVFIQKALGG
jgi:histidyl-tRNA synthetase